MDWKIGLGPMSLRADGALPTHVAWMARDFGRPELAPFSVLELDALKGILEPIELQMGQKNTVTGAAIGGCLHRPGR